MSIIDYKSQEKQLIKKAKRTKTKQQQQQQQINDNSENNLTTTTTRQLEYMARGIPVSGGKLWKWK